MKDVLIENCRLDGREEGLAAGIFAGRKRTATGKGRRVFAAWLFAAVFCCWAGSFGQAVAAPADSIRWVWLEAEEPTATNLPPKEENPYRPKAFWEADVLSGGDWIGMKWRDAKKPVFLEYEFDCQSAGKFLFYVRKFYTFGNFRWQLDGGAWHEVDEKPHFPLDAVAYREDQERIRVDWFYMGEVEMGLGKHKLRVEPVYQDNADPDAEGIFTPMAYDAFLFVQKGLFNPKGKLKPLEMYEMQTGTVFGMDPAIERFEKSPVDWLGLDEKVAGEKGGITVKDGRLVYRNSIDPVRLVGVNLSQNGFTNDSSVKTLARFLGKRGINLARFDLGDIFSDQVGADGKLRMVVNEHMLKLFLVAVQAMKDSGVYTALTWNMRTTQPFLKKIAGDYAMDLAQASSVERLGFMPYLFFEKGAEDEVRRVWKEVLGAKLPSGMRLGDDPAVAFVLINQQDSIFTEDFSPYQKISEAKMVGIEKAFGDWLRSERKGEDLAAVVKGWGGEPVRGDVPAEGRVGLLSTDEMAVRKDSRAQACAKFLAQMQADFYRKMVNYIKRDLKYPGVVSSGNKMVKENGALGWINAWSQNYGDATEKHGFYLVDFDAQYGAWNAIEGVSYRDRCGLRFDARSGKEAERFELPMRALSYSGKPVMLTELSWVGPNRYSGEMVMLSMTLASLQQVQVVAYSRLISTFWANALGDRVSFFTPEGMGQMPAFAYAFRKGYLPTGNTVATLKISDASIFAMKPQPLAENTDTQLSAETQKAATGTGKKEGKEGEKVHPALWATGKIEVQLGAESDGFVVGKSGGVVTDESLQAANGAVRWDYKKGLMLVDTPFCKVAGGFLKKAGKIKLGEIEIDAPMEFGVICAVSLDEQPISSSQKILVQVFSEQANAGSFAEGADWKLIRSIGRPPVTIKNLVGGITVNRPDAESLATYALDENGVKRLTVSVGGKIPFLPSTLYYLIEK